ncbi:MAG: acetate kinase [Coriobacteriia bacterium]|nr:acetate kinase [Coriobacteriia bacterium]
MKILVMNAGSSSLKYQLIDMATEEVVAIGLCERVGSEDSFHKYGLDDNERKIEVHLKDHHDAVQAAIDALIDPADGAIKSLDEIDAVGHRVVHGGEYFSSSVLIDQDVLDKVKECSKLAPLHNPAGIMGIEACADIMGDKPQIAVFDTAFHQTMPARSYMYPLPYELYETERIRRYGFHGTSHRYVAERAAAMLDKPIDELKIITCHLGNGCSITAVDKGQSVDTSMGFTPLEGLMMGTRCGNIDPAIVTYLIGELNMTPAEANDLMNKKSGLLGVSGLSNDLRDVRAAAEAGNERAILAYELYSYAVKRYIGSYVFSMGGIDAIVITAGVGENCDRMRRMILEGLDDLGIVLDAELNAKRGGERTISAANSKVKILIIPTNEELMIAKDVVELIG